ncbi:heptaprenyl diphosphate synthase component 1 [Neobacillus cucumis]|uniref:heptaprenyl diphosphate synthase component 1 n=1 Tax=Neobacillus cucumis TaxID=1740721 RepID=UPI001FDC80E5|nr:heptaprenyl diphosphate synthase component 1 [Neobacillus cucumis]MBM7651445.1 heptaprenyl diphosphate synthase [Neobacillus cucumis]MED4227057.1 heptaprenyl diphosphate synthase component 1 [Neobacillus cucumis]
MIKVQDIRQKFILIKEQVEKRVLDSYLLEYIEPPRIDEDKLLILVSMLEPLGLSFSKISNYTLATMLIQIALDTHEFISSTPLDEKKRQLTVLAGDYFSGLYYKLLADAEDINMIKSLSKGVKEVNENKILVYQSQAKEIESLMRSMLRIESSLLTKFSEYFKVELWNGFLANLLLFKRLLNERNQFLQSGSSILFKSLEKMFFTGVKNFTEEQQQHLINVCDKYLERSKQTIETELYQLPNLNDFLEKRTIALLDQFQPYVKTFVEEG